MWAHAILSVALCLSHLDAPQHPYCAHWVMAVAADEDKGSLRQPRQAPMVTADQAGTPRGTEPDPKRVSPTNAPEYEGDHWKEGISFDCFLEFIAEGDCAD